MSDQNIPSLYQQLQIKEKAIEALQALHILLQNDKSGTHRKKIIECIPLEIFYLHFDTDSEEEIELTWQILKKLMVSWEVDQQGNMGENIINNHETMGLLSKGIKHPHVLVRQFTLQQVGRLNVGMYNKLVKDILMTGFADAEVEVSSIAQKVLILRTGKLDDKLTILESDFYTDLYQKCKNDSVLRMRFFAHIIDFASLSSAGFLKIANKGFIKLLFDQFQDNDYLTLLNAIEIAGELLKLPFKECISYLVENQYLAKLSTTLLVTYSEDTMIQTFFLDMLKRIVLHCSNEEVLKIILPKDGLELLYSMLHISQLQISSIEVVGVLIANNPMAQETFFLNKKHVDVMLQSLEDNDLKKQTVSLHAWARIFKSKVHSEAVLKRIFNILSSKFDIPTLLHDILKNPFEELRMGTFDFLFALSKHSWSTKELVDHPTLIGYLLDRDSESYHNCIQAKYEVLANLMKTCQQHKLMKIDEVLKLQVYVKEGPFYKEYQPRVATETDAE